MTVMSYFIIYFKDDSFVTGVCVCVCLAGPEGVSIPA